MGSPSPSRRSTSKTLTAPQVDAVVPPRGSGASATKSRRPHRDTGFPEPFDEGRNTTLPHPQADLSPNASISQDEVVVERALKRHRLFFLNKHNKTGSHGGGASGSTQRETLDSALSLAATVPSGDMSKARLVSQSTSSLRLSKDDGRSTRSQHGSGNEDTPPTSPDVSERRRSKGLLGRLRRRN